MAEPLTVRAGWTELDRDFGAWMAAEQKRVYVLCYRMLCDQEDADSATQDAFLKAYQNLRRGNTAVGDPARWITRIAVNTCLDRLRSRKWQFWRRRPAPEDESLIIAGAAETRPGAEDRIFAEQIRRRVAAAMEKLSPRQHAVFVLRHFEDRSLDEIAAILDLDAGTVKAHMFRAVAKLRDDLRDLYQARPGRFTLREEA